jgi:hypothetical protein
MFLSYLGFHSTLSLSLSLYGLPLLNRLPCTCSPPPLPPRLTDRPPPPTLGQTLFARNKVKGNEGHARQWMSEQAQNKSLLLVAVSQLSKSTTGTLCRLRPHRSIYTECLISKTHRIRPQGVVPGQRYPRIDSDTSAIKKNPWPLVRERTIPTE